MPNPFEALNKDPEQLAQNARDKARKEQRAQEIHRIEAKWVDFLTTNVLVSSKKDAEKLAFAFGEKGIDVDNKFLEGFPQYVKSINGKVNKDNFGAMLSGFVEHQLQTNKEEVSRIAKASGNVDLFKQLQSLSQSFLYALVPALLGVVDAQGEGRGGSTTTQSTTTTTPTTTTTSPSTSPSTTSTTLTTTISEIVNTTTKALTTAATTLLTTTTTSTTAPDSTTTNTTTTFSPTQASTNNNAGFGTPEIIGILFGAIAVAGIVTAVAALARSKNKVYAISGDLGPAVELNSVAVAGGANRGGAQRLDGGRRDEIQEL